MIHIRIDDYPGSKPAEFYKHNYENFLEFNAIMQEITGKKYLLGVIPKHTSDAELAALGKMNIEIGMHGINHDERFPNEFSAYETHSDIYFRLLASKMRLSEITGQKIDTYMPPHNVFDRKTATACISAGFEAFTSGPETVGDYSDLPIKRIDSMPILEYGRSDELFGRGSVEHLKKKADAGETVYLTLHWPWEHNIGFGYLRKYLKEIREHVTDFSIEARDSCLR